MADTVQDIRSPGAVYTEQLIKVPWFVHEFSERKEIVGERSDTDISVEEDEIERKLRALGYEV